MSIRAMLEYLIKPYGMCCACLAVDFKPYTALIMLIALVNVHTNVKVSHT